MTLSWINIKKGKTLFKIQFFNSLFILHIFLKLELKFVHFLFLQQQNLETMTELTINYDIGKESGTCPCTPVSTLSELEERLPQICSSIANVLGKRNLEATYQRALKMDLEECGVQVREEVSIDILYKGKPVGTRRADLVVRTSDGNVAILELKAVARLNGENLKQLEYYLTHFKVDNGFLINFPHEAGFPDTDDLESTFAQIQLCGDGIVLTDRITRLNHVSPKRSVPQVIKVVRCEKNPGSAAVKTEPFLLPDWHISNGGAGPCSGASAGASASASSACGSPIRYGTTLKGTPCKICIKEQGFCKYHKNQAPK